MKARPSSVQDISSCPVSFEFPLSVFSHIKVICVVLHMTGGHQNALSPRKLVVVNPVKDLIKLLLLNVIINEI